jgi:hypothetical protein
MTMKRFLNALLVVALAVLAGVFFQARAVESWTQTLMTDVASGPAAKGNGVLQVGEVSTLSAAVASAARTQVVAAPTAGSIYLRGLWIEKSATSSGLVTVSYGTGTNCGSGTTTLLSLAAATSQTLPFGYQPIGIQVPATKALCLVTEGANTSVRALAQ